jgi:Mn-containing catalase
VIDTEGLVKQPIKGTSRSQKEVDKLNKDMSKKRSQEVKKQVPTGQNQWSDYPQQGTKPPKS